MKTVDRFQIKEDLAALTEALRFDERFLKASDPSICIMNFIEKNSNEMGAIKHLYAKGDHDRNVIVDPVTEHLQAIIDAAEDCKQSLSAAVSDPEDENDALPADKDT